MEINLQSDEDMVTFDLNRLVSLINAVGSIELNQHNEEVYCLGDSAFDVLQDLKNILKEEELTNQRPTLKWLINKKFVETDLLPILQDHLNNKKISLTVLELLVPLTWPTHHQELQVYHKKLFAIEYHLNQIKLLVVKLLGVEYRKREERDHALLRLSMLFFRNILRIQDLKNVNNDFELIPLHEQVVVAFQKCKIFDLVLKITSNLEKKEFYSWNSILLDIYDAILPNNIKDLFQSNNEFNQLLKQEQIIRPRLEISSAMKYKSKINVIGVHDQVIKSVSGDLNPDIQHMEHLKQMKYRKQKKFSVQLNQSTNTLLKEGNDIVHNVLVQLIYTGANPLFETLLRDVQSHKQHCTDETRMYLIRLVRRVLEFMSHVYRKNMTEYPTVTLQWTMLSNLFTTNFTRFIMLCLQSTSDEKQHYTEYALVAECFAFYIQSLQLLCQDVELLEIGKSILSKLFYDERLFQIITLMTRQARFYGNGLIKSCIVLNDSIFRGLEFYKDINDFIFMKTKIKGNERQVDISIFEKYFANEPILETYVLGLEMPILNTSLLHAIIKMLHKILFNQDMLPLIFKMRYLNILLKQVQAPLNVNKNEKNSLIQLTTKIANSIKRHLEKNPKHVIEFYCTKTKTDVYRINGNTGKKEKITRHGDIFVQEEDEEMEQIDLERIKISYSMEPFKVNLRSISLPSGIKEE